MTRAITLAALTCLLLGGASVAAILGRDSVPAASEVAMISVDLAPILAPVPNREPKQDRLEVAALTTAGFEPLAAETAPSPLQLRAQAAILGGSGDVHQAHISANPTDVGLPKTHEPPADTSVIATAPAVSAPSKSPALPKPKLAAKPVQPKPSPFLSDTQIAGIKQRLRLTSDQEYYWPPIERALRAVAHKANTGRQTAPAAGTMPIIDPDSEEIQQLKSAAMPLLFQLREDQKSEVRSLAHTIGLDKVAAMI